LWIEIEAAIRIWPSTREVGTYQFQRDDLRIALFFLFFVQVAFFGTGKYVASNCYLNTLLTTFHHQALHPSRRCHIRRWVLSHELIFSKVVLLGTRLPFGAHFQPVPDGNTVGSCAFRF
jgi:hypothetical protein